eukprot:CAMPEP_0172471966 /NCGR_PEP_ID=MMETSP1065-20121228/68085_1 /TAXON_ID=265537 /ORGANISM="Amphiprora paludosa, Strain CCMP125" /LENGTH=1002 /DNA_ID=CAMNT_0013230081 /DNA_START=540 /DNA_END=3545 /DNA_ORIENTATION=+
MKLDSTTLLFYLVLAAIGTNANPFHLRSGKTTTRIHGAAAGSLNARNQMTRGLDEDDDSGDSSNSSTSPTQLAFGTELFQDTIYSEPVIAQNEAYSHAVIEGARGRLKLQSNLSSTDPSESTFLDTNYHLGLPEVIQFEQNSTTSNWELVHYRYPWEPRSDNVRTDALERIVIMDSEDGLDSPTGVWSITGTFTNRIYNAGDGTAVNNFKYALFVQQSSGNHFIVIGCGTAELSYDSVPHYALFVQQSSGNHFIVIGCGTAELSYDSVPTHPLTWSFQAYNDLADAPSFGDINRVDKYTSASWSTDYRYNEFSQFSIENGVEHIIIYGASSIVIISLLDYGQSSTQFSLQEIPYYSSDTDYRVFHLGWIPPMDDSAEDWYFINNVTLATYDGSESTMVALGDECMTYDSHYQESGYEPCATSTGFQTFADGITYASVTHLASGAPWSYSRSNPGEYEVAFNDIESIHDLYSIRTTESVSGGLSRYTVKLANIKDEGMFVLVECSWGDLIESRYSYFCGGMKLDFPDLSGIGEIINFSGGTSKFGGFRFILNDANGNLFLMRQRSIANDSSSPYETPIYGLWDEVGSPISDTSFLTKYSGPPTNTSSTSNLQDIGDWVSHTHGWVVPLSYDYVTPTENLILAAALMFSTDETSVAQGYWLGTGFQAAYALKRFGQDSSHVVVSESASDGSETSYSVQAVYKEPVTKKWTKDKSSHVVVSESASDGSETSYSVQAVYKEPVTKKWHKRQISTQTLSTEIGTYDTGDHYHVTFTVTNDDGQPVSLGGYSDMLVEVRADSPCTAVDDTNNYYHDIDRYTSFTASPNPGSSSLDVVVKASGFSQVLYARLITSTSLTESASDGSETSYSVQAVYKEPVTKKWHKRQVSTQSESTELGVYDTGDHYHVTLTVTNDDGQAVSLDGYSNILVEVRADSPCTAVDDTNNYYHDIDRYTSFTASPNPGSSSLDVVVKASGFSQVLYARLITSTSLNQTSSDSAMLDSSSVTY